MSGFKFCPQCRAELAQRAAMEDGGERERLRCTRCDYTHWNNPTPVLAAVIECTDREGRVLLARNSAWPGRFFGLVTGFLEAGESPEDGIRREIAEETQLRVETLSLLGVWDFKRLNQIIIAYAAQACGEIRLSPELAEFKLLRPDEVKCWPQGTGQAMATWLRQRGIEPQWLDFSSTD